MSLKGKICVITGGGSGIGRATAIRMAHEGAKVVIVGRTITNLNAARNEIQGQGGIVEVSALDITDLKAVQELMKNVAQTFGRIDVLVNNAGDITRHRGLSDTAPDELQSVINTNIVGAIYCCQAVVPVMIERQHGTIINVSSLAGIRPALVSGMIYSATKAAVINFTYFLNKELQGTNIRASVIIPGEVSTPMLSKRPHPPTPEECAAMLTAQDVAEVISFIAGTDERVLIEEVVIRPSSTSKARVVRPRTA
jgi:NADP-dependent 3-hydroxy acid dehydrogenase YdfG